MSVERDTARMPVVLNVILEALMCVLSSKGHMC